MRFDYTKGKEPRYMVSSHRELTDDHCYFHYYKEAAEMFEKLKTSETHGTSISLYDLKLDVRKAYARV